jgi:hypothetical protein
MNATDIARVCHEVNRAYCKSLGDESQPAWDDAPQWQKDSALAGVQAILTDPATTPEQSHEGWLAQKRADGWTFGPVKYAEAKTHPCFVPYAELPAEQRVKDYLFGAVVRARAVHCASEGQDGGEGQGQGEEPERFTPVEVVSACSVEGHAGGKQPEVRHWPTLPS